MKCPICGGESRVLETRAGKHLTMRRRRQCFVCLGRFETVEIHSPVFCSARQRAMKFEQTVAKRVTVRHRDLQIAARLHEGAHVLAREFKITRSAVFLAAKRGRGIARRMEKRPSEPPCEGGGD